MNIKEKYMGIGGGAAFRDCVYQLQRLDGGRKPKRRSITANTETSRPESYYQALREWKKTDHSISFGWFSGWGDPAVLTASMLMGLPDSMDMVSLWDNSSNLSQGKIEDLRMVQQKKGTKVLMCTFIQYVGKGFNSCRI